MRVRPAEHRVSCETGGPLCRDVAETLVKLLAPIAPHFAEELWQTALGHADSSVHVQPWPEFDPALAAADEVELAVQLNGKVKAHITVAADAAEEDILAAARQTVASALEGKTVIKEIVVPKRLVNLVVK